MKKNQIPQNCVHRSFIVTLKIVIYLHPMSKRLKTIE